ncbi:MAG TPA: adenylate cyclase regulatory domain-containing protein [Solirubrobacteraceae bacterium]|nr:adenylate cyclase regulatory domain-containing protein [Solirubrobacteraceae bacterium]
MQVAELAGADVRFLLAARRALGLPIPAPDERAYAKADIEALRIATLARDAGVADEEMLELMRTLGRGLARSAQAMRALALQLAIEPAISEHELAKRYARVASDLGPLANPLVANLLAVYLRHVADSEAITSEDRATGQLPGSREVTVCFADLVGFTRLGERFSPHELSRLARRLERLVSELCVAPVTLVKTIGDAAMLTCPEASPLVDVALELLDVVEDAESSLPQLHLGAASGPALSRAGDWFGAPVNVASRITQTANPGTILVESKVRRELPDGYQCSYIGRRRLRGLSEPLRLYRVRRDPSAHGQNA